MTKLSKPLQRETSARQFERGKNREVIVSLEPPSRLGFRLKGTKRTFYLEAGACYDLATKAHLFAVAKEKKKAKKQGRSTPVRKSGEPDWQ